MFQDPIAIEVGFYILIGLGIMHFFRKNDELLAAVLLFFFSACLNRYNKIADGTTEFVFVAYAINIFKMNAELAYEALVYMFLGTAAFTLAYITSSSNDPKVIVPKDTKADLNAFLNKATLPIIIGFAVVFIASTFIRAATIETMFAEQTFSMGVSYGFYFAFAVSGAIVILFLRFRTLSKSDLIQRLLYLSVIALASTSTYDQVARFRFMSWLVPVGVIAASAVKPTRKFLIYTVGGFVLAVFFSYFGAVRLQTDLAKKDFQTIYEASLDRLTSAEDQNMLDGMMMIMQVYPYYLPHTVGMEHFEILLRPIPRSWWPDKPVGGYANKLGLNDNMQGATVGISPSIYGSFYAEGSLLGVILLSALYGWLINLGMRYARRYSSDVQFLIRGMAISSLIPLLRGGDLPGIVAFVGMAYWPIFVFLYYYNAYLTNTYSTRKRKRLKDAEVAARREAPDLITLQRSLRPENA